MINNVLNKIKGHPHLTEGTAYAILFTIGTCHLLNDMIQSVIPAIYPLLKEKFGFTFAQIGIITLVFQLTSSVLQPFVGRYADRHPQPYSLATGMCFTLTGLIALAFAPNPKPRGWHKSHRGERKAWRNLFSKLEETEVVHSDLCWRP